MIDQRLLPGIIGGLIGFGGALLLSVVARWREDEKSRIEQRVVLAILIAELEHRHGILLNKYADVDLSHDIFVGDLVKKINRGKSGVTFNYTEELMPYQAAFNALKDRLGAFSADVAVGVWRHYTTIEEFLLAHDNAMDAMSGDQEMADEIRAAIRTDTEKLIGDLKSERSRKSSRAFLKWLPIWLVGKS